MELYFRDTNSSQQINKKFWQCILLIGARTTIAVECEEFFSGEKIKGGLC